MKMVLFFLAGMVTSLLIAFAVFHFGSDVNAQDSTTGDNSDTTAITDATSLLPDTEEIYHICLTEPFKQVEGEIHDPSIADYYHKLMQATGLTEDYTP